MRSNVPARSPLTAWAVIAATLAWASVLSAQPEAVAETTSAVAVATDQPNDADNTAAPIPQTGPTGEVLEYEPAPEDQITADDVVSFPVDI